MAIDGEHLIQSTRGTVFIAPAETALPDGGVSAFQLSADSIMAGDATWSNMGHTSNDNKLSFSTSGGAATTHDTWLMAGARTTYATTEMTVTGRSVQVDTNTLKQIVNGWDDGNGGVVGTAEKREQKFALFILAYDSGASVSFGIYLPNTSFTYSSSNFINLSSSNFMEIGFEAKVLTSSTLPKSSTGVSGTYALYPPTAWTDSKTSTTSGK